MRFSRTRISNLISFRIRSVELTTRQQKIMQTNIEKAQAQSPEDWHWPFHFRSKIGYGQVWR
ncbi:hypothetical protein GCM10010937_11100 [Gluconobacter japonicus]|uniref:Transposase n=1 Tax=Gluconobacter japonicus TaxID=376620 RepID=A0ABQ5WH84_GLUJA|nr:hypothetical protein AA3271_2278 [Gluconobacter japonicus NBRC 3271]GLQ59307.1 hypothetical protein GCM10010937_11100 [Gluconobacter japonicus]